jgi:hypothetical protein
MDPRRPLLREPEAMEPGEVSFGLQVCYAFSAAAQAKRTCSIRWGFYFPSRYRSGRRPARWRLKRPVQAIQTLTF